MKLIKGSLKTRVAQRIFFLFVICSVIPVSVFAIISFIHVKNQLIDQANITLQRESKSLAVSFFERLDYLRSGLQFIAAYYESDPDDLNTHNTSLITANEAGKQFLALAVLNDNKIKTIYGIIGQPFQITEEEREHIRSGKVLLKRQIKNRTVPVFYMCTGLHSDAFGQGILIGKIDSNFILDAAERKPPLTELLLFDKEKSTIYSSLKGFSSFTEEINTYLSSAPSGQFEWQYDGDKYMAGYSSLFLKPNFFYQEVFIVLCKLKSEAIAPVNRFIYLFVLIIVLTLGLVFLLSINLIRKSMVPIELLKEGTRKVAEGFFGHRVSIKSGDEFESLGDDFNEMSIKLKEGQDLLVNAARMSTMGQMATGIMHEIKQPLTAISGNIELAMLDISDEKERRNRLKIALKAVDRLGSILDKFRSFSLPSKKLAEDVSINNIVNQVFELMEHEIRLKNIKCIMEMDNDLPFVNGDGQELQQVVSNLLVNSIHALEDNENNNRRIIIRTTSSEEKVCLSIEDNGCGIPEDLHDRIFDPFFTTKSSEKGTGLGMAVIQAILHRHKAAIKFVSETGKGTIFTITFPLSGLVKEIL